MRATGASTFQPARHWRQPGPVYAPGVQLSPVASANLVLSAHLRYQPGPVYAPVAPVCAPVAPARSSLRASGATPVQSARGRSSLRASGASPVQSARGGSRLPASGASQLYQLALPRYEIHSARQGMSDSSVGGTSACLGCQLPTLSSEFACSTCPVPSARCGTSFPVYSHAVPARSNYAPEVQPSLAGAPAGASLAHSASQEVSPVQSACRGSSLIKTAFLR